MSFDLVQAFMDEHDPPGAQKATVLPPNIDPDTQSKPELLPDGTLVPRLWGSLCFDLALNRDYEGVCADYGMTLEALSSLLDRPAFVDRLKDANLQVKTLGPSAGFVLASRIAAEEHVITLGQLAKDSNTNPAIRVRAIENLVRYAHLDPSTNKPANSSTTNGQAHSPGVLVQLNIGAGLMGSTPRTIEVKTSEES